jgi:hypothetical protein
LFRTITPLSKQSNKWSFPCHKSLVFLLSVLQEEAWLILFNRGWGKSQQALDSLTGWCREIFTTIKNIFLFDITNILAGKDVFFWGAMGRTKEHSCFF